MFVVEIDEFADTEAAAVEEFEDQAVSPGLEGVEGFGF